MDMVPYVVMLQDFVRTHPLADMSLAFLAGGISGHPVWCADLLFKAVVNTPLKHLVIWNWPKISEWIDTVQARFGEDVEDAKKSVQPPSPQIPPTEPPAASPPKA